MPTTVTHSIGVGAPLYTTVAAWFAACPANLVTADQVWRGECKNQTFSVASGVVNITGITTDATRYIVLTTETGASFRDHANKLTNALRYNTANGAAFTSMDAYTRTVLVGVPFTRLVGLQIMHAGTGSASALGDSGAPSSCVLDSCILENVSSLETARLPNSAWDFVNTLLINRTASADGAVLMQGTGNKSIRGCTLVRPGNLAPGGNAIEASYASIVVQNTAVFGFSAFKTGGSSFSGDNNATDLATVGFGSGHQTSLTFAGQFETVTDATHDFRAKSGGALIDVGTTDGAYNTDIVGTSRSQGAAYDVGCWELAVGEDYVDSVGTPGGLALAASGPAVVVADTVGAPSGLLLAVASGLSVVVDWFDQVASAGPRLALAGGVALAGAAQILGRIVGFMANPNRLLGR